MLSLLPRELRELLAEYVQPHLRIAINEDTHIFLSEPCFSLVYKYDKCWIPPITIAQVPLIESTFRARLCYDLNNLTLQLSGAGSVNLTLTGQDAIQRALGLPSSRSTLDSYIADVEVSVCLTAKDLISIRATIENSTLRLTCIFCYSFSGDLCGISRTENGIVLNSKEMRLTLNSDLSLVLVSQLRACPRLPEVLERLIYTPRIAGVPMQAQLDPNIQ